MKKCYVLSKFYRHKHQYDTDVINVGDKLLVKVNGGFCVWFTVIGLVKRGGPFLCMSCLIPKGLDMKYGYKAVIKPCHILMFTTGGLT